MSGLKQHYAAEDIESRLLSAIRTAGLDPENPIAPEALGALDHFHTGGLRASLELMALAGIAANERVLDIGAGLAGCARLIADKTGSTVDCIEMSADYCTGALFLNRLTGLDTRISVHQGSALDMPFAESCFDVVWMQNVGMNIQDKHGLYAEIFRVLKPGGRFAFQEMAAGETKTCYFPLPWASDASDSFLALADDMISGLTACGFKEVLFEDTSEEHMARTAAADDSGPSPLSLGVYVDNLSVKAGNAKRSLAENQIRLVRGIFQKPV